MKETIPASHPGLSGDEGDDSSESSYSYGDENYYESSEDMSQDLDVEDVAPQKDILLPKVMDKIFGFLDVQSLKQVRLVCKPWLLLAQVHMERKGVVKLKAGINTFGFQSTCEGKIPTLPTPFMDLDVTLPCFEDEHLNADVTEFLSRAQPLLIKRLDTSNNPPNKAIPHIGMVSSSLTYLHLEASERWEGKDMNTLDPNQKFPELRHINVEVLESVYEVDAKAQFLSVVRWLVSSSPELEIYELSEWRDENDDIDFISALVMQVDIRKVKAVRIRCSSDLNDAALSHLISIPFEQLEALEFNAPRDRAWVEEAVMGVVARSYMTLKKLDLSYAGFHEQEQTRIPICPNVQHLRLKWFPVGNNFLPAHFPSLQTLVLNGCFPVQIPNGGGLSASICGLKKLRIIDCETTQSDGNVAKLFENFPSLEFLTIEDTNFMFGCSLQSEWMPKSLNFLKGVKHLVVKTKFDWSCKDYIGWYSLLSFLTGLESLTLHTGNPQIINTLPIQELPRLEVLQFHWIHNLDASTLVEMMGGVKKVLISNCCSVLKNYDARTKCLMKSFFESSVNVQCGCGQLKLQKPEWFPEEAFVSAADEFF